MDKEKETIRKIIEQAEAEAFLKFTKDIKKINLVSFNIEQVVNKINQDNRTIAILQDDRDRRVRDGKQLWTRLTYSHRLVALLYNKIHGTNLRECDVEDLFRKGEWEYLEEQGCSPITEECKQIPEVKYSGEEELLRVPQEEAK